MQHMLMDHAITYPVIYLVLLYLLIDKNITDLSVPIFLDAL